MNWKLQLMLIFVCSGLLLPVSYTYATPGDTFADATVVGLGTYSGTLVQYNDVYYYNFTATASKTYNFTMSQTAGNDIYLVVYDGNGNHLATNSTPPVLNQRSEVLTGYDKYIVGILASEFCTFPADYSLIITEVTNNSGTTDTPTSTATLPSDGSTDSETGNGGIASLIDNLPFNVFWAFLGLLAAPIIIRYTKKHQL